MTTQSTGPRDTPVRDEPPRTVIRRDGSATVVRGDGSALDVPAWAVASIQRQAQRTERLAEAASPAALPCVRCGISMKPDEERKCSRSNFSLWCSLGSASPAALDVTDKDAVLDRLHNDPVARYFYEAGKAEGHVALRPLEPADPIVCEAASPAALDVPTHRDVSECPASDNVWTGPCTCGLSRLTEQEERP